MTDTATTATETPLELDPNAIGADFEGEVELDKPTDEEN